MIKGVFFDIDGTLLSTVDGSLASSTKKALSLLKEQGIKIFIASGRHLCEIQEQPIRDIEFDGYVCLNGQLNLDAKKRVLFSNPIKKEDAMNVVSLFDKKKYPIVFVEEKRLYINFVDEYVKVAQDAISTRVPDIDTYNGDFIYQITAFVNEEEGKELMAQLPNCKMTRWNPYGIDIISTLGGKALGIQKMLDHYHLKPEEVMAFGDGDNDVDMLKYVGIGVAMANASPNLIEIADYITGSSQEDGIYKALNHYGLV